MSDTPLLPPCCTSTDGASLAERLYCAYNAAGPVETAGLNYQGKPCPVWAELPEGVQVKWQAVADERVIALAREMVTPAQLWGDK